MRYKARDCWKCILKEYTKTVYNNAIDDFVKEFNRKTSMENKLIDEIAEQLKAGEYNV